MYSQNASVRTFTDGRYFDRPKLLWRKLLSESIINIGYSTESQFLVYLLQIVIILMQGSAGKITSPERSRSIKLKVSNKIFPQDFFKRSSSQSPTKENKNDRYVKDSPQKKCVPENSHKSQLYWDLMREQLQKCRDLSQKDKAKQIQRIWVYSEKKNRTKPLKDERVRHESRQEPRKQCREDIQLMESPLKSKNVELKQGLFTFFGKSPTKGFNFILPPIK